VNHTPKHFYSAHWKEYGLSLMFFIVSLVGTRVMSFYTVYSLKTNVLSTKCLMKFKYNIHTIIFLINSFVTNRLVHFPCY
jgi:hypothetical protein